jgi:hypothetical protein
MAITKKPKPRATSKNVDVDALIRKGGSVASEGETTDGKAKVSSVVLRLPADVAQRVNLAVKARQIKTPRHTWLLEAVMEKLERE